MSPMVSVHRSGCALIIAALALVSTPLRAQTLLSTREMTALPPKSANRAFQQDLLSVLKPVDRIRKGMFATLRGVSAETRPFGGAYAGLCRKDTLSVYYAPTDMGAARADRPLQPYGLEVVHSFHVLGALSEPKTDDERRSRVWSKDCDRLDKGGSVGWFTAHSDFQAAQAINLLRLALSQVSSSALKVRTCDKPAGTKESCETVLLKEADLSRLNLVEQTVSADGKIVYDFLFDGFSASVTIEGSAENGSIDPTTITSVSMEHFVVVT